MNHSSYTALPQKSEPFQAKQYGWGWRHSIAVLSFWAFFVTYMLRVNLNVAIVAMVNQTAVQSLQNSPKKMISYGAACLEAFGGHSNLSNETNKLESKPNFVEGSYVWDEKQQGNVLSAFYYGYFITQLPGGVIAGIIGPKWVFGIGLLLPSVLTLFTSAAAAASPAVLMGLRFVEGLGEGVLFPAMHTLLGKWIPPMERSKIPAFIYAGYYVGTVTTFACSGFLAGSSLRWPSIFYISGGIGCAWFIFWVVFVSDSPEEHRWISKQETDYIVNSIKVDQSKQINVQHRICQTPWLSFAKSLPLYAITVSHFCHGYGFYTILIYLPIYLRNILGYDIQENGAISAMPYLLAFVSQIISSWVADYIRHKHWLSTTKVRKLFDCSANSIHALCLLLVTFVGCDRGAVLTLLGVGTAVASFCTSGFSVNHLDIGPIYAGELMGITNCIANITGFLVPTIVATLTEHNQTLSAWAKVFYIAASLEIFATLFYAIFASGKVQHWAKDPASRLVDLSATLNEEGKITAEEVETNGIMKEIPDDIL